MERQAAPSSIREQYGSSAFSTPTSHRPKEYGLGPGVVLHGSMEVQMILCQIGKGGSLEVDAPHPVQSQGMGGDLHHHIPAPCRSHPGQQALEGKSSPVWCALWGSASWPIMF